MAEAVGCGTPATDLEPKRLYLPGSRGGTKPDDRLCGPEVGLNAEDGRTVGTEW